MQSKFCIYSVYPMGSVWKMNRATERRTEMIHKKEKENEDKRKEKL